MHDKNVCMKRSYWVSESLAMVPKKSPMRASDSQIELPVAGEAAIRDNIKGFLCENSVHRPMPKLPCLANFIEGLCISLRHQIHDWDHQTTLAFVCLNMKLAEVRPSSKSCLTTQANIISRVVSRCYCWSGDFCSPSYTPSRFWNSCRIMACQMNKNHWRFESQCCNWASDLPYSKTCEALQKLNA